MLFTLAEGYLVAVGCAAYNPTSVLLAVLLTCGMVLALTGYAMYSKTDYTIYGGILMALLAGLILCSLILLFVNVPFLHTLYSFCAAVIFSLYIVVDTQMVLGKGETHYDIDEYIMAAVSVYLDIINLLIALLQLIGDKRE